jgi:hypothetical protein
MRLPTLATALLATAVVCPESALGARPTEKALVHWQRKRFEPGDWPERLPAPQRAVLEYWTPWCTERGYRMDLDDDGRVLLLSSARLTSVRRETDLVRKTRDKFDELLPWVAPSVEPRRGSDEVARGRLDAPHAAPIVLLRFDSAADHAEALAHLARQETYLADWAVATRDATGFFLHQPLCAGWRDDAAGREEWRPDNELVHNLAQALVEQRFGRAPYWLGQGLAWQLEDAVTGSLYAFPGRDGFVAVDAHQGWRDDLQKRFKKRGDIPVAVEDLAGWPDGTWDEPYAAVAWGVVTWLEKYRPEALPALAADLGAYRDVHEVQTHADGSWVRDPRFRVPARVQGQLLAKHAGADALAECARFFEKGRGYRPPRRPRAR